jgi:signal transduction histidine kinase/ABC-type uncharacterized transport system substrate-binding protein
MSCKTICDQQYGQRRCKLVLTISACLLLIPFPAVAQVKPTKRVLVFNEFGLSSPAVAMVAQEIQSSLENNVAYRIELYNEYLETALFPDEASQQEFRAWYVHKYRDRKPDVMVAVGPAPIAFLASYHTVFFPDVPVVFCGSSREQAHNPKLDSHFTGAWIKPEPNKTLDVALRLLPATKLVAVVGGVGPLDSGIEAITRGALHSYESKLEIRYVTQLDMPSLLDNVRQLPKDSIVFYTSISVDASGRHFISAKETAPMVAAASDVPVFGMGDVLLGTGIVGGYVVSYSAQGKLAAQMIRRILTGEKPESIPIIDGTNAYVFDWMALRRWKLKESRLPNGSIVLFRIPTIWERYPGQIIGTGIVLLALLALSAYLLFERRRRRSAEVLLQSNLAFERLISELSSYFINLTSETIDPGIRQALDTLLSFFKVDRISVLEFSVHGTELLRTYSSSEAGNVPTLNRFRLDEYPWFTTKILNKDKLLIADLENIVGISGSEKGYFTSQKIRSLASIPLEAGQALLGALVLIMVRDKAEWSDHLLDQLTAVGQVFANALVRKRADDALVSSEMLKGAILSALSSSVTVLNETGEIILTNSRWREFVDPVIRDAGLVVGTNYFEACKRAGQRGDDAAKKALEGMEAVLCGLQERFELEWKLANSASQQYSLMTVTPLSNHVNGLVVSYADVTARKQAEEERLELSGRLIRAQEDERSRLARELHDDFNQRLAVLAIDLERTASVISDSPIEATRRMHELWNRVSEIGADLHSLSHRLHSSTLESLGLVLGVSSFCRDFTEQQGIQVDFAHKEVPRRISPEVALCIFRIVQEGLRNVKRHSGASRAEVRLEGVADTLHLSLTDEGIGFDNTNRSTRTGLGIRSMQERLRVLGGRVEIRSLPKQGTTIDVWVPLGPVIAGPEMTQSADA